MDYTTIEKFLNEEYSQTAMYASYRAIANYIDGLKPSSRKVVYTVKKKNIKQDSKVSRLASSVAETTEYLHGEGSLAGVISGMAQNYIGSNNDNLLYPSGSFGTRFVPIPSASRYIFTRKSESFDYYFKEDDDPILISQEFEGSVIEPKFFVPILPLLLINGSEGIGTGFAQKVLPRNPESIKKYIQSSLSGKSSRRPLSPFYKGFNGSIKNIEGNSWEISGTINILNSTTIEIIEVPIGYTLSSYIKVLDNLVDSKVIKSYQDKSEDDNFYFEVSVTRDFTKRDEDNILNALKLKKRVTENLTCIDENNSIIEFNTVEEILEKYIKIRLEYYSKRKAYLLNRYKEELDILNSKAVFIDKVIKEEILVNNKPKKNIEEQIFIYSSQIIKVDDSYDYLLKMPIYSLTKEKYEELMNQVKNKKQVINNLKTKTEKDLWLKDFE